MSSNVPFPPPGFEELSSEEQADYVEALSEHAAPPSNEDIPEWHKKILDERMAQYDANGMEGISLEELEEEIFEILRKG